ncbi:MAG TPA: glucoamylase family protein, partial [Candidatus Anammoximicrobium sp.]|nr:glucoamylase family protein [Candidatus Anammoximicrobium sp.]
MEDRRLLATDPGIAFLQQSVDFCHRSPNAADLGQPVVYLYSDSWSGCTYGDLQASAMTLDGNDPDAGQGTTSLRASWDGAGANGWFQFWIGDGQANRPRDIPAFGLANHVRFMAKGDTAGQDIHARIFKVPAGGGWELVQNVAVDLSTAWQDFAIDLAGLNLKPHDLHAVQFVIGDGANDGGRTFWVDEVRVDTEGFDPLRVPVSYRAQYGDPAGGDVGYRDGQIYPNRSFLYDSALTIKALVAAGDSASVQMARDVADALVATKLADGTYYNARNCGHVLLEDGTPRASFSQQRTLGDQAWFGLALLDVSRQTGDSKYLERAIDISDWAENNLKDNGAWKGYRGGYDPDGNPYPWRSTEHNIDLFALNRGIAVLLSLQNDSREATFVGRATHAGDFVMNMFDAVGGKFWTGTGAGNTIDTDSVPLDAQTWSLLTLARFPQYAEQIDWRRVANWVEDRLQVCDGALCGLTYSDQSTPDIVWLEGTAQAAVAAWLWRDQAMYERLIGELEQARASHPNGDGAGIVAASRDTLLDNPLGAIYDARLHVGATAWTYFATAEINPLLPELELPEQSNGMSFVVDDWNNKVTETDLGHNYFAGNSGAVESTAGTVDVGLSAQSSGMSGGSLELYFDFSGAPAESFAGVFTSLFGLTDTLVSLDGSGQQPAATTPFAGYYLDMTDIYRGFGAMEGRSIDRMQMNAKLLSSEAITVKIQLQDEAGFDVFTRRTIHPSAGGWETISVAVPAGFDDSLAGDGNPAGFNWRQVSLCSLIVERVNVGAGIVNPDTAQFLVDNLVLIDADGSYPDVAAAADPAGLGLNPYFEESFLDLVRATSSQYFVDWASTDARTGAMIQDRSTFADLMTVGGAGFQLTSYVVDAQQAYLTRADAADRVLNLLRVLRNHPQGPERVGTIGYQGFFYHFLGIDGLRKQNFDFVETPEDESQNTVELSAIDTGLVLAGVVTAGQYFDDPGNPVEAEIRQLAEEIYGRVDFRFLLDPASNQFYLGWKPNETRDDSGKWGRYLLDDAEGTGQYSSKSVGGVEVPATIDYYTDEGLLLALLAMGSPNPAHRLGREVWDAMIRDTAGGDFVRSFPGSLFTYEFASVWLDTNRLGLDNHPTTPVDFFVNTQAAVQATRMYVEANPLNRATWQNHARLW